MKVGLPALRAAAPGGAVQMQLSGPLPPRGLRFIEAPAYSPAALGLRALPLSPAACFRAIRLWWVRSCRGRPRFALSRRLWRRVECPAKREGFSGDVSPPPLGAVRCSSRAVGNGGRLRAGGACAAATPPR